MNKCIVYQLDNEPVSILIPCDCGLSLEQIGKKDVPTGVEFWIIDSSNLPTDRTFRDSWELDVANMGSPSGTGDPEGFFAERAPIIEDGVLEA